MDLPEPDAPTTATVSPGSTRKETPRSTGSDGTYPNRTSSNSIPVASGGSSAASGLSVMTGRESMMSNTRMTLARGFLPEGDHVGEHADRAGHQGQVGGEGQERAEGDGALNGQPAAQREHADQAE